MSIIKKLLGGPGFFAEADESTAPAPSASQPTVAPAPVAAPVVEEVTVAPEAAAPSGEGAEGAIAAPEAAPVAKKARKSKKRKSKKKGGSTVDDAVVVAPAAPAAVVTVDPVQALIDQAIQSASTDSQAAAEEGRTFATDFLVTPSRGGRRRPGPSLGGFMDMASNMRR